MKTVEFFYTDNNEHYNMFLQINLPNYKIQKLLDEYRNKSEFYNMDGFRRFLKRRGIPFKTIRVTGFYF